MFYAYCETIDIFICTRGYLVITSNSEFSYMYNENFFISCVYSWLLDRKAMKIMSFCMEYGERRDLLGNNQWSWWRRWQRLTLAMVSGVRYIKGREGKTQRYCGPSRARAPSPPPLLPFVKYFLLLQRLCEVDFQVRESSGRRLLLLVVCRNHHHHHHHAETGKSTLRLLDWGSAVVLPHSKFWTFQY